METPHPYRLQDDVAVGLKLTGRIREGAWIRLVIPFHKAEKSTDKAVVQPVHVACGMVSCGVRRCEKDPLPWRSAPCINCRVQGSSKQDNILTVEKRSRTMNESVRVCMCMYMYV